MFSVVQFIEKSKFQIMVVPSSWIHEDWMLWPIGSNKVVDKLRTSGTAHSGKGRKIPIITLDSAEDFVSAEKKAEFLATKDVSDVDTKKRKLARPARKPKRIAEKKLQRACKT